MFFPRLKSGLVVADIAPSGRAFRRTVKKNVFTGFLIMSNYIRLTSSRFLQNNGTVRITVESGMTGFILPMQISRK